MFSWCPVICACVRVYVCVWPACRRRLVQSLMNCGCDVHRVTKTSTFLFFEQLCQKLTDFGTLNPENISHENLAGLSTSSVRCSYFTLGNPKKSHFHGYYLYIYFSLFVLSVKTNCNPLAHTTWKCHNTNLWIAKLFNLTEVLLRSFKHCRLWRQPVAGCYQWLWKEPVVMCGNWNVRQAMLQQVFRVTTLCINTCFQFFSTLISRTAHHAVLKFSPCRNKPLPQASTSPYQYMWSSCSLLQMLY